MCFRYYFLLTGVLFTEVIKKLHSLNLVWAHLDAHNVASAANVRKVRDY